MHARSLKLAATIGFVAAGLAAPVALAQEDPANVVYSAEFENGKIVKAGQATLGKESFGRAELKPKDVKEDRLPPEGKIQPALLDLLASGDPHKPVEIVVNYRDPLTIPTFPMPVLDEDRESPRNKEILGQIQGMIGDIKARRADLYKQQSVQLEQLGGKVLNSYWLIQGTHVSLPLEAVKRLSADDQVDLPRARRRRREAARRRQPGQRPGRRPRADLLRPVLQPRPDQRLDRPAGHRRAHDARRLQLAGPHRGRADLTGDGDPSDQCDHGTASAGEITGNARLGNNWRGVSAISVDSWDVYGNDCSVGSAHTVAGFEAAVSWADRVIVAEIQLNAGEASASSTAADAAFDAGSVVIAANGNFGPGAGTVRSPGNAHKAIGIGAADLQSDALMSYSGRGPSADGRFKPDLVFPTNIEAPRASSDTALGSFGGTSAATPIAGGAAGLLRNWMRGGVGSIDAGHVYSHMILGGQTAYPFNNNTGAGPFQLGTGGHAYWGKTNVDQRRARRHPDLHPGRQDQVRGLAVVA